MPFRHALLTVLFMQLLTIAAGGDSDTCVYAIYVRTGSAIKAGTDARISLTLGDANGGEVSVTDLASQWGLMGPHHDYFERSNLDLFAGRGPCLGAPLCWLNLTSDGSGAHPGWFCDYVETTLIGEYAPCSQTLFYVRQWVAEEYNLTVTMDGCDQIPYDGSGRRGGRFVLGGRYRSDIAM